MATQVWFKRGSSNCMKKTVTSPKQAKRLLIAIKSLQSTSIEKLERAGVVKKLKVSDRDDIYTYHVNTKERIVFSPVGEDCVIHDIMTFDGKQSGRSLLTDRIKVE